MILTIFSYFESSPNPLSDINKSILYRFQWFFVVVWFIELSKTACRFFVINYLCEIAFNWDPMVFVSVLFDCYVQMFKIETSNDKKNFSGRYLPKDPQQHIARFQFFHKRIFKQKKLCT